MDDEFGVVLQARKFVEEAGIDSIPADLDRYLSMDGVNARCKVDNTLADDEAGQTTVISGRHCIFVNGRHSRERQRFTICHELAHIVLGLPSIHEQSTGNEALLSYVKRPREEVLCDVFAAECLLPSDFFKSDVDKSLVEFEAIERLATDYEASLTSTGSRFALHCDEPCAFILIQAGQVRYVSRSKPMREWKGWVQFGMPVPPASAAGKLLAGQEVDGPIEVDADLWLENQTRGGSYLLEDARHLESWDQVLSLIWFESDEAGPLSTEDDDEEPLLDELTGELPWPSKSRRR